MGSNSSTTKQSGDLQPRSRVKVSGEKISRKHQGCERFELDQPDRGCCLRQATVTSHHPGTVGEEEFDRVSEVGVC